jgi:hypothetical protein
MIAGIKWLPDAQRIQTTKDISLNAVILTLNEVKRKDLVFYFNRKLLRRSLF